MNNEENVSLGEIFIEIIFGAGLLLLIGWVVMLLWNCLMPTMFGLFSLTYWQTMGFVVLIGILGCLFN